MENLVSLGRDVGDCEIRSIAFQDGSVYLKLFDPNEFSFFTIIFHKMTFFNFETDHTQNVIEAITISDSILGLGLSAVPNRLVERANSYTHENTKLAYIRPITGGEGLIVFETFELGE
jgi:hypothetical protein